MKTKKFMDMNKRWIVFGVIFIILFSAIYFIAAETPSQVGDAYKCLRDKITEKTCSKLTTEEQIFSLLADSKCKKELVDSSKDNLCWSKILCKTKATSQAIIALNDEGTNTKDSVAWLLGKKIIPSELTWYLQIDSSGPSTCQITYDSKTYNFDIGEDKKIKSSAGTCLSISSDGYWFKIKPNCLEKEFSISCNERFSTSLIYQKKTSSTIYVSENLNSASAEGTTTEKVNSYCFQPGDENVCDYESTLWASSALKISGQSVEPYLPYLVAMADENEKYLPESFLYKLTKNKGYYSDLVVKQLSGYWEVSGDKFYDTAIALYSMQGEDKTEKTDSISWLLGVQDKDGCWKGISETAFLLHAVWQQGSEIINDSSNTEVLETCTDLKGDICTYDEECKGEVVASKDGKCCLDKCEKTSSGGTGTVIPPDNKKETNYTFIWVLGILIILTIIGIVFRNKLRVYWFIFKSRFGKGSGSQGPLTPPGFLPPTTQEYPSRPRRILHPSHSNQRYSHPKSTPIDKEFSDVLKKLKDIGS